MIKIKLDAKDLKRIEDKLKRIKKLREPLFLIGQALESSTKLRFNHGVDPTGKKWQKRSPKYIEQLRRQRRLTPRVLVVSGNLQRSIDFKSDNSKVVVGTPVEYSAVHQTGEPKKNIPQREFLGLSKLDKERIEEIIEKHIEK